MNEVLSVGQPVMKIFTVYLDEVSGVISGLATFNTPMPAVGSHWNVAAGLA
jgi:hypothetical protein